MGTTNRQTLQLGTASTGNINFFSNSNVLTTSGSLTLAGNLNLGGIITANTASTINGLSINNASQTISSHQIADSGTLTLTTGGNGNLTLTPNGSGNTVLTSTSQSGVLIGSASNTIAPLSVSGGIGGNAAAIINQTNSGDIFTASASGQTRFTIANNGNLSATGTITGLQGITSAGNIQFTGLGTGVVQSDNTGLLSSSAIDLSNSSYVTNILPVSNGGSPFDQANGAIFERLQTQDLLLGSNATSSAKFAFVNVNSGTPTASISGTNGNATYLTGNGTLATTNGQTLQLGDLNTGNINFFSSANQLSTSGNLSIAGIITANTTNTINGLSINASTQTLSAHQIADSGTLTITTGTNNDLTLTAAGTGNTILTSDFNTGVKIGSASNTIAPLSVSGGIGGNAAAIINQTNNGDIFTASASGATKFTIARNGNLTATGTLTGLTGLTSSGQIQFSAFTSAGGPLYTNGTGVLAQTPAGATNTVLHGGATPTFSAVDLTQDVANTLPAGNGGTGHNSYNAGDLLVGNASNGLDILPVGTQNQLLAIDQTTGLPTWITSSAFNFFQRNNGAIAPLNTGDDFLLGGNSTESAKFAFVNNADNSGTPTASIAAITNGNALSIDANGNVQTAIAQTLTLGGPDTGNVQLVSGGTTDLTALANGNVGIGTTAPANFFSVGPNSEFQVNNSGAIAAATGIVSSGQIQFTGLGTGVVQSDNTGVLTSGPIDLSNNSYVTNILPVINGGSPFDQANGTIFERLKTQDLLLGSNATSSAKFAFTNVAGGIPTASLSATTGSTSLTANGILATTNKQTLQLGNANTGNINFFSSANSLTTSGNLTIAGIIAANTTNTINGLSINGSTQTLSANNFSDSGALTIATGANTNLTLTPGGSGNTILSSDFNTGVLIGSSSNTIAPLSVSGGIGNNAAAIINQTNSGDIFTASASGTTKFTIANNGNLTATGTLTGLTGLTSSGQIQFSAFTSNGGPLYTNGSGVLAQTPAGGANTVLHGGTTPTFSAVDLTADVTGILPIANGGSPFNVANGSIFERNTTEDLLLGSTATTSAKFAFTNVAGGTPTASISGNTGATSLTATGILGTTAKQTLQLGTGTTGNINFFSSANVLDSLGNLSLAGNGTFAGGTGLTLTGNNAGLTFSGGGTNVIQSNNGGTLQINAFTLGGQLSANAQTIDNVGTINFGANNIAITGNTISTTGNNLDINIIPNGSGNSVFTSDADSGVLIGSNTNTLAPLSVSGGIGGNAAAIINQTNSGDIFTASSAGTTEFTIANDGTVQINELGVGVVHSSATGVLSSSTVDLAGGVNEISGVLPIANGGTNANSVGPNGAVAYSTGTAYGFTPDAGLLGQCLTSDGGTSAPVWQSCALGASQNFWDLSSGALHPIYSSVDLIVGGTSTASAKFAFTNVGGGTPTASISGSNNNATSLTATGVLGTTNAQTLQLGNASTGNVQIISGGTPSLTASGPNLMAVGTLTGLTGLTSSGTITFSGIGGTGIVHSDTNGVLSSSLVNLTNATDVTGLLPVANGGSPFDQQNGAIFERTSSPDLLLGSNATGSAKFAFVNVGSGIPTASLSAGNNVNTFLTANGNLGTTNGQTLTLGGSSTGNIVLNSGSGLISLANNTTLAGNFTQTGATNFTTGTGLTTIGGNLTINGSTLTLTNPATLALAAGNTSALNIASGLLNLDTQNTRIGIGTTTPQATLDVAGNATVSGNLTFYGGARSIQTTQNQTLTIGGNSTGNISIQPNNGAGQLSLQVGALNINGAPGVSNASASCVTTTNGIVTGIATCVIDNTVSPFTAANGAIIERNQTQDLLLGSSATASARFAFTNVNSGTPTASVSAGTTGASSLTATGILGTTNNQTLQLGNGSTGNINFFGPANVLDTAGDLSLAGNGTFGGTTGITLTGANAGLTFSGGGTNVIQSNNGGTLQINAFTLGGDITGANNNISGIGNISANSSTNTITGFGTIGTTGTTNFNGLSLTLTGGQNPDITTTGNNNLTITPAGSGNTVLSSDFDSGVLIGSSANTPAPLSVSGGIGGNAAAIINQTNSGDIFTASASGNTAFTIANNGNITATGTITGLTGITSSGNIQFTGLSSAGIVHTDINGNLSTSLVNLNGGTDVNGILPVVNGGSPFEETNGAITERIPTEDLLLGGTATASAKFGFLNVNSGTPTASVSGTNHNATYLTATGTLATTNGQTLQLGVSGSTGNINFFNGNNVLTSGGNLTIAGSEILTTGTLQIGNTSPAAYNRLGTGATTHGLSSPSDLLVSGSLEVLGNLYSPATGVSGYLQRNANALSPTNITDDLLLGSTATTSAKFAFTNVAGGIPTASASAGITGATSLTATGILGTTNKQTLQLGTANTGNINFFSSANVLTSTGNLTLGGIINAATTNTINGLSINTATQTISAHQISDSGALTLTTNGDGNLTLTPNGSGNTVLTSTSQSGVLIGSASNTIAPLSVSGGIGNNAAAIINQTNSGDIFTASSAGATKFTISNNGNVGIGTNTPLAALDVQGIASVSGNLILANGPQSIQTQANNTLTIGGNATGTISLQPNAGTGTLDLEVGALSVNGAAGVTNGSASCVTTTNGIVTGVATCVIDNTVSPFTAANGAIIQRNTTQDFLLGATATASAKFAVTNVNSGTPTASLSAGISGATFLSADGKLQTTNAQNLTIGGGSTGNITISPASTTTINGTTIFSGLGLGIAHISSTGILSSALVNLNGGTDVSGILPVANGGSPFEETNGAITERIPTEDLLLGATSTASAKFAFTNVNSGIPTASISGTGNNATFLTSAGVLGTTNKQTLQLGNASTGNINFFSNANNLTSAGNLTLANNLSIGGIIAANTSHTINGLSINAATQTLSANNFSDSGPLTIATGANGNLTLTPNGSGNTILTSTYQSGVLIGSSSNTIAPLSVSGGIGGNAAAIINQTNSGDIFTASASGNTAFTIANNGNITATGTLTGLTGLQSSGQIQFNAFTSAGGPLYTDVNGVLQQTPAGNTNQVLHGGANPTFSSVDLTQDVSGILPVVNGGSPFTEGNGSIFERNTSEDLLLGSQATTSAKFAFTNVAGGIPTASISAGTGNNAAFLTGTGVLGTSNKQSLTLGNASTGNINFFNANNILTSAGNLTLAGGISAQTTNTINGLSINGSTQTLSAHQIADNGTLTITGGTNSNINITPNGSGNTVLSSTYQSGVLIGSNTNTLAPLSVTGGIGGNAATIINQINSGDIFTASSAGNTKFTIANNGNLTATGTLTGLTGLTSSGTIQFTDSAFTGTNALLYATSGTGVLNTVTTPSTNQCLLSGPSAPVWGTCALGTNFWQLNAGALSPGNSQNDLLIGGSATASAKFAFTNNSGGIPTASISANSGNNATFLTGTGVLGTTNAQTLQSW